MIGIMISIIITIQTIISKLYSLFEKVSIIPVLNLIKCKKNITSY